MSDPSAPDEDAAASEPDETQPADDTSEPSDAPTEIFDMGDGADEEERRFSAPSGFDVMSTEKIEGTPPEPPTEVFAMPGNPARPTGPQAIPPRAREGRHRSWLVVLALIVAIAVVAAIVVAVIMWATQDPLRKLSQEDMVRQTIQDFDTAIQKGDLVTLRGITCGTTRDQYVGYHDEDWASTYQRVSAAKQYPVVASIDQVVVNGQHAEANVTTFMAYAPQVRSTRSFDLQFLDNRWKICEGPLS